MPDILIVDSLPVDVLKICRAIGVKVVKNSIVNDLEPNEYGKSYYDGKKWIIIYNDKNDVATCRFTVAHELGHIFLGHALTYTKYRDISEFGKKSKSEQQADMFALRLLCPACVLKELNVQSAEELAALCRVPLPQAEQRYRRLKELDQRNKYLTSDIEREVYKNFQTYLTILK